MVASFPAFQSPAPSLLLRIGESNIIHLELCLCGGPRTDIRFQRAALFTANASEDLLLEISLIYPLQAVPNQTLRIRVDNIDVRPSRRPFIAGFARPRTIGDHNFLEIEGTPGVPYFLFLSFGLASSPIVVSGITGEVLLDPIGLRLFRTGIFDVAGMSRVTIDVPNDPGLSGVPIHWQTLQFNELLGIADLGWATTQGFK